MVKSLIEQCLDDKILRAYIRKCAIKIAKHKAYYFDVEDAEQEMWEAILRALSSYTEGTDFRAFVFRKVYSRYGNLLMKGGKLDWEAWYNPEKADEVLWVQDKSFSLVEANITLDTIEKALKYEAGKSKTFKLALSSIKLQRKGYTQRETAGMVGVSIPYMHTVMMRTRKRLESLLGKANKTDTGVRFVRGT